MGGRQFPQEFFSDFSRVFTSPRSLYRELAASLVAAAAAGVLLFTYIR